MTFRWLKRRSAKRPNVLMQKVEHIERSVEAIEQVLSEQAAQKPAAPTHRAHNHDTDTAPFEPDEPFAEPGANDE